MPARSKPRAQRPSEPDSLLMAENSILKVKNLELARALTDYKMQCAQLIQENSGMQKQLFDRDCENLKMKECFKRIDAYSRSSLNMLILMSKDMTQIVHNSTRFLLPPANDYYTTPVKSNMNMSITNENTPNLSTNKTRVVKPMISGHTILSPTINLQRVPREQMEHLMNTLNDDESTDSDDEPNDESQASLHSNLGRQNQEPGGNDNESCENNVSALSDDIELELRDHGLDTLQEEDENVSSLDSPLELHHGRLRSNSFENIKVSKAPMKRPYYNISGSPSNEDHSKPCIKSNGSLYCATTDSSSEKESNSTDLSIESNKGDLNDTTTADVFNNSDALPEDPSLKNLSTVVNSNLDLSDYQNNLSTISSHSPMPKDNLQHIGKEISIQSRSNVNTTLINSYDPLEGPSSLLDNLHSQTGNKSKTLRSLDMGNQSIRNHTSTPYSPRNINKRQKKSKPSDSYESFIATPDVSQVSPPQSKVTRRKIKSENHYQSRHLFDYNSDDVNVQKFRKCSVRICQLPRNKLSIECRQKSEVTAPTWNQDQRTSGDDTPNSISNNIHWRLDIRCGPNSDLKEAEPLKTPILEKTSPYKRARRNINVVNLREPSLRKKLRRSR